MSRQLEMSLFPGPVVDAPADTFCIPLPEDERPLRGDAGWIDWRTCGRLSQQLASGYVSGAPGEATLLPAGPPFGAARVLLVGAGGSDGIEGRPLLRAMRGAAEKLLALRSRLAVLALPGAVDFVESATPILRGFVHGLAHDADDARLHVVLPDGARVEKALLAALSDVVPSAQSWGVDIEVSWVEAEATH